MINITCEASHADDDDEDHDDNYDDYDDFNLDIIIIALNLNSGVICQSPKVSAAIILNHYWFRTC